MILNNPNPFSRSRYTLNWISHKRLKTRPWKANRKQHPSFRMVPVWMTFNDLFKVTLIQRHITWKWYNIQLYLQWPTNRKSYYDLSNGAIFVTFSWPWTTSTPSFKVTPSLTLNISETVRHRHSFNEILIGSYTRPTQQCHFEWPLVTLSDLAKIFSDANRRAVSLRQLSFLLLSRVSTLTRDTDIAIPSVPPLRSRIYGNALSCC